MIKYSTVAIIVFLFMVSCGPPQFEKNTRILVTGNLLGDNDNAISNAEIKVYTERLRWFGSSEDYLLGYGFSNEEGRFKVVSLLDSDEDFSVEIDTQDDFSKYIYKTNTKDVFPEDLILNLSTVVLRPVATVNYSITKTSSGNSKLQYSFNYLSPVCYEYFDPEDVNSSYSDCFPETLIHNNLNEVFPEVSSAFKTLVGTTVEFSYVKDDQSEVVETFTINNKNYEFNFTY